MQKITNVACFQFFGEIVKIYIFQCLISKRVVFITELNLLDLLRRSYKKIFVFKIFKNMPLDSMLS